MVGQHFVSIANRSGREQFREISLEIHHPRFQGGASAYDVALVRLAASLQFNDFVQPIALPAQSSSFPQSGTITSFGWGMTTDRPPGVLPDELQVSSKLFVIYKNLTELFSDRQSSNLCHRSMPRNSQRCCVRTSIEFKLHVHQNFRWIGKCL